MDNTNVIGMDISKQLFELCWVESKKDVARKRLNRGQVLGYFRGIESKVVVLEAGGGAHYWGRKLKEMGHEVKLIAPQFVKPFVRSNKNDRADAQAILVAATAPGMRFVSVKSVAQQELQHLHRVRSRMIKNRTAANNELRGMLLEYGIVVTRGTRSLSAIPQLLDSQEITSFGKALILKVLQDVRIADEELKKLDRDLEAIAKAHPVSRMLQTIPGVGPIIATAIVASVSDPSQYKNGRQFSASLGLVPRHVGTGGANRTLGISKRGDCYIRKQLIHGARSLMYRAHKKTDKLSCWVTNLKQKRGWNRAAVAMAKKNARIIWAVLRYQKDYSPISLTA